MRISIVFVVLLAFCLPLQCLADDPGYQAFLESRELLATFHFQVNSDTLTASESKRVLDILPKLRDMQNAGRMIRIEGYASPEGDRATNLILSMHRARNVAEIIASNDLPAEITLTGYGDLLAARDKFSAERRVEVVAYQPPENLKKVKIAEIQDKTKRAVSMSAAIPEPMVTAVEPAKEPMIDALAIEQAIMEKIGAEPAQPSGTVSQVDKNY